MPDTSHAFSFAGVSFEFQSDSELKAVYSALQSQHLDCVVQARPESHLTVCRALCKPATALTQAKLSNVVEIRNQPARAADRLKIDTEQLAPYEYLVSTGLCAAHITKHENHFVVEYLLKHEEPGPMVSSVGIALAQLHGGLILHTTMVEFGNEGVAFVGPSGAGKTTTCNHLSNALWFARDRACVLRHTDSWWCWALPGGDNVVLKKSTLHQIKPKAICRVNQCDDALQPSLEKASDSRALLILRESIQAPHLGPTHELSLLEQLSTLAKEIPVYDLFRARTQDVSTLLENL